MIVKVLFLSTKKLFNLIKANKGAELCPISMRRQLVLIVA